MTRITKLCNTKDIVTVNGMYPGPVLYAREDDKVAVKVTNDSPYNITIHWYVLTINTLVLFICNCSEQRNVMSKPNLIFFFNFSGMAFVRSSPAGMMVLPT